MGRGERRGVVCERYVLISLTHACTNTHERANGRSLTERPKLDSLPRIAVHDEHVLQLHITVHEAPRVEIAEAGRDPVDDGRGGGRVEVRAVDGELERAAASGGVLKLGEQVEVVRREDRGLCEMRFAVLRRRRGLGWGGDGE